MHIPFNKPYITGGEFGYIANAIASGKISGNGKYTQMCQEYLEQRYGFQKALLTASCTDALEMCALLLDIQPGDEVIVPSFTFVSSALAFVRQGAKIVFADSHKDHPGVDEQQLEVLVTPRTKAIVVIHYAGNACDMEKVMQVAQKHNLFVVEDAAQAVESYYIDSAGNKAALGTIGHLSAFSFHETKNIQCGEGGLLAINDPQFISRAEIIWEKGTNRAAFFRGEIDKYGWIDTGSSFLPSEITAAFLWAQLEAIESIQARRLLHWNTYFAMLENWAQRERVGLPTLPAHATHNAHMFYLVCPSLGYRSALLQHLKENGIHAVFHYQSLHNSLFYARKHDGRNLPHSNRFSDCLVRLPLFYELSEEQLAYVISCVCQFNYA